MLIIAVAFVVPVLLSLLFRVSSSRPRRARDLAGMVARPRLREEIARHGDRRPRRRADLTVRRSHLAAVLPADARD